jgi:hypothetical protein
VRWYGVTALRLCALIGPPSPEDDGADPASSYVPDVWGVPPQGDWTGNGTPSNDGG